MRALLVAAALAFGIGGFATSAHAGEGCSYLGHEKKMTNDFEAPAPAPASAAIKKPEKKG